MRPPENTVQVESPATVPMLAALLARGELGDAAVTAYADTPALRERWPDVDDWRRRYAVFAWAAQHAPALRTVPAADLSQRPAVRAGRRGA